jgi:phosphatidylglycerophosphatase A
MENNSILNWLQKAGASVLFIGYLPASGTVASAVTVAGLWLAQPKLAAHHITTGSTGFWLLAIAAIVVSTVLSSRSRELFGKEDSGRIVIDEVAGQLITFLFLPLSIRTLILGFVMFRFFDIIKPWPVHCMEELAEGVGVTMDDVAAGVLANISILIILFAYHAVKSYL